MILPSKLKEACLLLRAFWMVSSCWATTDSTCMWCRFQFVCMCAYVCMYKYNGEQVVEKCVWAVSVKTHFCCISKSNNSDLSRAYQNIISLSYLQISSTPPQCQCGWTHQSRPRSLRTQGLWRTWPVANASAIHTTVAAQILKQ
jgi:hypothetical protein